MLVALPPVRQTHTERYLESALPPLNRAAKRAHIRTLRLLDKKDRRLAAVKAARAR